MKFGEDRTRKAERCNGSIIMLLDDAGIGKERKTGIENKWETHPIALTVAITNMGRGKGGRGSLA